MWMHRERSCCVFARSSAQLRGSDGGLTLKVKYEWVFLFVPMFSFVYISTQQINSANLNLSQQPLKAHQLLVLLHAQTLKNLVSSYDHMKSCEILPYGFAVKTWLLSRRLTVVTSARTEAAVTSRVRRHHERSGRNRFSDYSLTVTKRTNPLVWKWNYLQTTLIYV